MGLGRRAIRRQRPLFVATCFSLRASTGSLPASGLISPFPLDGLESPAWLGSRFDMGAIASGFAAFACQDPWLIRGGLRIGGGSLQQGTKKAAG